MEAVSWLLVALLTLTALRRLAFLVGAALTRKNPPPAWTPSVLVVVTAHDEAWQLEPLLDALSRLDYPREQINFVLVSDGSRDETAALFRGWCQPRTNARAVALPKNIGKAAALNHAAALVPDYEILVVYDADQRPKPRSLRHLAGAFADPGVGAVSGYCAPWNARESLVARYAALEAYGHQLIIQAGKERWGLNPTTMGGNCGYRRRALEQVGGFPAGSYSEDIEVSLAMAARGWRTRFVEEAAADKRVAASLDHYVQQRRRWSVGMYRARRHASGLESWAVALGYADRILFLATIGAVAAGLLPFLVLGLYLAPIALTVPASLLRAGVGREWHWYLLSTITLFPVDIVLSLSGMIRAVAGGGLVEWGSARPVEAAPEPMEKR